MRPSAKKVTSRLTVSGLIRVHIEVYEADQQPSRMRVCPLSSDLERT